MRLLMLDRLRRAIGAHDLPGLRGLLEAFVICSYDRERVKEVGADRAAAEWIVRCEGKVKFDKLDDLFIDYNELIKKTAELDPRKESDQVHVVSIDATDSSVTGYGCRHFGLFTALKRLLRREAATENRSFRLRGDCYARLFILAGLSHLKDVRFIRCRNLHDYGLDYMGDAVGKTLLFLQIESCPRITEFGLENLVKFSGLRSLILHDLKRVHGKENVLKMLRKALPHCDVRYPEARLLGS
uniref:Mitochondrial ATP synthase regulatory component factor B n=1 Tax=Ascaris lumbricoides TaxID=6252 RepID=A0A9J2QAA2_ASCLU